MAEKYLATYLNDHLAGSQVGHELGEHLEGAHAGTPLARADITFSASQGRLNPDTGWAVFGFSGGGSRSRSTSKGGSQASAPYSRVVKKLNK
jgi:hypothetical protein